MIGTRMISRPIAKGSDFLVRRRNTFVIIATPSFWRPPSAADRIPFNVEVICNIYCNNLCVMLYFSPVMGLPGRVVSLDKHSYEGSTPSRSTTKILDKSS